MTNGKRFFFDINFYAAGVAKDRVFISPGIRPGKFATRKSLCQSLTFASIHLKKEHVRMLQTSCRDKVKVHSFGFNGFFPKID